MELTTERLRIRPMTLADLDAYAPIAADPDVMRYIMRPQTVEESRAYIEATMALFESRGLGRYAVELKSDGRFMGWCGFRPEPEGTDLGYRYAKWTWGQGYGYEAASVVRLHGLETLGITDMVGYADRDNVASVRILDRLGFATREDCVVDGFDCVRFSDVIPPG